MPHEIGMAEAEQLCRTLLADMGIAGPCDRAQRNGKGDNGGASEDPAAFDRALACVSMVWDGVVADPTNGATRAHPHNEQPDWSEHCQATALIGPMLFFRADPVEVKP